jgi:hypothetical protein
MGSNILADQESNVNDFVNDSQALSDISRK